MTAVIETQSQLAIPVISWDAYRQRKALLLLCRHHYIPALSVPRVSIVGRPNLNRSLASIVRAIPARALRRRGAGVRRTIESIGQNGVFERSSMYSVEPS